MASAHKPPTVSDDARAKVIYRRAAEIISKKGFDATSMGDIANAVDLTKGGLYYYIKGKKELLFAIMRFAIDLLETEVIAPAGEVSDPEQRLTALVSGHIRLMLQDPSAMTILVTEDERLEEEHRVEIAARKESYPAMLRDCIAEIMAARATPSGVDPTVAAYSLLGMIHWVVRWHRAERAFDEGQLVSQLTQLALYGIIPTPTTDPALIA